MPLNLFIMLIWLLIMLFNSFWAYLQEIKFEPCVMCEHLDKKTSFRLCQVIFHFYLLNLPVAFLFGDILFLACRLKMEISFAFRNLLLTRRLNASTQLCLRFLNMSRIDR